MDPHRPAGQSPGAIAEALHIGRLVRHTLDGWGIPKHNGHTWSHWHHVMAVPFDEAEWICVSAHPANSVLVTESCAVVSCRPAEIPEIQFSACSPGLLRVDSEAPPANVLTIVTLGVSAAFFGRFAVHADPGMRDPPASSDLLARMPFAESSRSRKPEVVAIEPVGGHVLQVNAPIVKSHESSLDRIPNGRLRKGPVWHGYQVVFRILHWRTRRAHRPDFEPGSGPHSRKAHIATLCYMLCCIRALF